MHREGSDQHRHHEWNGHPSRRETNQQEDAANELRADDEHHHEFRQRQPKRAPQTTAPCPFKPRQLRPPSLNHHGRENQPQQQRRHAIEGLRDVQGAVIVLVAMQ